MRKILLSAFLICQLGVSETKISQLPLLSPGSVTSSDLLPLVNGVTTKRLKVTDLLNVPLLQLVGDSGSGGSVGFCPAPPSGGTAAGKFLKASGLYVTPPTMVGDSGSGGSAGYAPAPPSGSAAAGKFLKADGTYVVPGGKSTGEVFMTAATSCPSGSITADGTSLLRTGGSSCGGGSCASLFSAISTTYGAADGTHFTLPDLRGVFPRGAGSQTIGGITYTGTQGTTQGDQLQGHFHSPLSPATTFLSVVGSGQSLAPTAGSSTNQSATTGAAASDGTNGTPRTGTETRPANIALKYCIVY